MFVKKLDKKKMYMLFGIVMLIIAIAGSAYAYYSAVAVDNTTVSGTVAGGANLELKVEKVTTGATGNLIPVDNDITTLTKAVIGEGNTNKEDSKRCIDKNGYTACQIYKITLTNKSSVSVKIDGGVTLSGSNTPNIECAKMDNINKVSNNNSCKGNKTLAKNYNMNANASVIYYIMVYIKNINSTQTDTGLFTGTVFFNVSGNKIESNFSDDPALTTLTNLGLSVDTSHTPDFTTVSGNSGVKKNNSGNTLATGLGDGTNGVYAAEDDLGTSYYFRGNVDNNYVYFAKNWWQIIRINGDGTIRMIYTSNPNDSSANQYISFSAYNSSYNDNAYVGYMYGSAGSSTYNATHTNTNNSTIKGVIDTWYQNNLSSYSQYIADAIYCNDREVVQINNVGGQTFTGNGAGTNESAYASLKRNFIDHNPTLKCTNNNDKFTVSNTLGNGALTNPIGLPTTDEIVMSGANAYDLNTSSTITNDSYYLYPKGSNYRYWTMTPSVSTGGVARVGIVGDDGVGGDGVDNDNDAVRPVISLKSDAISGGAGTVGNPFYVNEEYSAS